MTERTASNLDKCPNLPCSGATADAAAMRPNDLDDNAIDDPANNWEE